MFLTKKKQLKTKKKRAYRKNNITFFVLLEKIKKIIMLNKQNNAICLRTLHGKNVISINKSKMVYKYNCVFGKMANNFYNNKIYYY